MKVRFNSRVKVNVTMAYNGELISRRLFKRYIRNTCTKL